MIFDTIGELNPIYTLSRDECGQSKETILLGSRARKHCRYTPRFFLLLLLANSKDSPMEEINLFSSARMIRGEERKTCADDKSLFL